MGGKSKNRRRRAKNPVRPDRKVKTAQPEPPRNRRELPSPRWIREPAGQRPSSDVERVAARTVGSDAWRARREDDVVALVNEARLRAKLAEVRVDERLRKSARAHSADMAQAGYFAHEAPGGAMVGERLRAAGYPWPGTENIACGQADARSVMASWMASDGHRENILDPRARTVGVGMQPHQDGPYWTQHFGYE